MKTNMYIYSAARGEMEGQKYSSVYNRSEENYDDPDKVGLPPMKTPCEYGVIDQVRGKVPGEFEVEVSMIAGSGNKASLFIKTAKAVNSVKQ